MKKKKTQKQDTGDVEMIELIKSLSTTIVALEKERGAKATGLFSKRMIDNLITTFTDILQDNVEFRKMLADPKTDLAEFEPIIKKMIKKNGRRKN